MSEHDRLLEPGTLHPALLERTAQARRSGAIHSLPTTSEIIRDGGVSFEVRLVEAPVEETAEASPDEPTADPFLPHDPNLFVADISPTHLALLNKYHVAEHHLLIVTREFEEQQSLLTQRDCEALLVALTEIDGLAFYNAGPVAGASQRHKHWQLIPFPEAAGPRVPIEPLVRSARTAGEMGRLAGLPFPHAYGAMEPEWLDPQKDAAASLFARYRQMLRLVGLSVVATAGSHAATAPYNLLVTRQWLLLIPRSQECFEGMSINALGFAGALLAREQAQVAALRKHGPMTALTTVALPQQS